MPRRYRPPRREVAPDVRFGSEVLARFINRLMYSGKRSTAERIVYDAFDLMQSRAHRNPLELFEQAVRNVTPVVEVKPRRVGGATYQVPIEVIPQRRQSLALRWLTSAARQRPGKSMARSWRRSCSMPPTAKVPPSAARTRRTVWPRPTARSPITVTRRGAPVGAERVRACL